MDDRPVNGDLRRQEGQSKQASLATGRIGWIDIARGVGIVLVVVGHVERGLVGARIATDPSWQLFDLALYSFHMPLFMLLAGLNVPQSLAKGRLTFLRGKLRTIAYPYLLWSLIHGSLLALLAGATNRVHGWSALGAIAWQPIAPFWFLYALMVYMLVVSFTGMRAVLLVPLALMGTLSSQFLTGDSIAHQLCYQAIFFAAGVLASKNIRNMKSQLSTLILFGGLWAICFAVMPLDGPTPYLKPAAIPAALSGIGAVLIVARAIEGRALHPILASLGRASMTIYVMHILCASAARMTFIRLHLLEGEAAAYLLVCTVAGVGLPWCAHQVLGRLGWLPWLGLSAGGLAKQPSPAPATP